MPIRLCKAPYPIRKTEATATTAGNRTGPGPAVTSRSSRVSASGCSGILQLRGNAASEALSRVPLDDGRVNRTALPNRLKRGVEALSRLPMDDVQVHRNSPEPARLGALAYTRGSEIHLGPGQEAHLPHELWHVVQQKRGRVKPTMRLADGIPVNDDSGLEAEADAMGRRALQPEARGQDRAALVAPSRATPAPSPDAVVQRQIQVGGKTQSWQAWQAELDPDNDDPARRDALAHVLSGFDHRQFATEKQFVSQVAAATAPLEAQLRQRNVEAAERQRSIEVAERERQQQAPIERDRDSKDEKQPFVDREDAPADESFFESREAAFQYVADNTDYDVEELEEFAKFEPQNFGYLTPDIGPSDIDLDEWQKVLAGVEHRYHHQPEVGTGRKSKADWANKPTRAAAKELAAGDGELFPGGAYTVHHKVSRHRLRELDTKMAKAGSRANPVLGALRQHVLQAETSLKALLNIPANLEVGPQERIGDPGPRFDANYENGTKTPRSETLQEIDNLIKADAVDFDKLAERLRLLAQQQEAALKKRGSSRDKLLTKPIKSQWTKENGKFRRG